MMHGTMSSKKTEAFRKSHSLQIFSWTLDLRRPKHLRIYNRCSSSYSIRFFCTWNKTLYAYNQAQNVVSFDKGFTIYLRFQTTLDCGDATFARVFIEKLPVNRLVRNAWAPLMELKISITIFTRRLLCTVSWVNVHFPHFSRTENYYRVCVDGMSLFSINQKKFWSKTCYHSLFQVSNL